MNEWWCREQKRDKAEEKESGFYRKLCHDRAILSWIQDARLAQIAQLAADDVERMFNIIHFQV